jgi:hypothetical protein
VAIKDERPLWSLSRVRKRQGRCYELAMTAAVRQTKLRVVHGRILIHGHRLGHAWVLLPDGRAYDPVKDRFLAGQEITVERIYTAKEAAKALLAAGHYGPWHEGGG